MNSLLQRIDFGNETGEDASPEELLSYFVEQDAFRKFVDAKDRILIATAKKGVGKSALLQWASCVCAENDSDALVIRCRGADLARSHFNLTTQLTTPNEHIR